MGFSISCCGQGDKSRIWLAGWLAGDQNGTLYHTNNLGTMDQNHGPEPWTRAMPLTWELTGNARLKPPQPQKLPTVRPQVIDATVPETQL